MNRLMKYFTYEHLPPALQDASAPFCNLARELDAKLPESAEKTTCFRKLLEAKDCAVRAALDEMKGET